MEFGVFNNFAKHTSQNQNGTKKKEEDLEVGDNVFITDEITPPYQSPFGRIIEAYRCKESVCQVAKVETARESM